MRRSLAMLLLFAVPVAASASVTAPRVEPVAAPATARAVHTATRLPDGRVLVAGGCVSDGCGLATATTELFTPGGGFAPGPRLRAPRDGHTATLVRGGAALVIGGYRGEGTEALRTAELCTSESCRPVGPLRVGRGAHAAVSLRNGLVLVSGGYLGGRPLAEVELYDPRLGTFRPGAPLRRARWAHTATRLADGRILVTGGFGADRRAIAEAELFDPRTRRWSRAGHLMRPRGKHAAVRLLDGRVLLVGGSSDGETRARIRSTELFEPRAGRFVPGPTLQRARYKLGDAVALLPDGRVVVAGDGIEVELVSADARSLQLATGGLEAARAFATATPIEGGILVVGGYDETIAIRAGAFLVRG